MRRHLWKRAGRSNSESESDSAVGLPGSAVIALLSVAFASPLETGERLEWRVSWLGIEAGTAWSRVEQTASGWAVEAGCRNAGWLDRLYPIDDWMRSEFGLLGSTRYVTRFREGRFHQDQDMRLGPPEVLVARNLRVEEAWVASEARYPWVAGAEDPVSAVFRLRRDAPAPGGTLDYPVFNGKRTLTIHAEATADTVEGAPVRKVALSSASEGDYDGGLTVWLSEDADRVPVRVVVHTRAGPVEARLLSRSFATVE